MSKVRLGTLAVLGLSIAVLSGPALAETFELDPDHTEVRFTWDHLGLSRQGGRFSGVTGKVDFDPDQPAESKVDVTIPMKSLSTGIKKLDEHLITTREFFDVASYPTITFKSTGVTMKSDRTADVSGTLTINGISKPVVLDVLWNGTGPHPLAGINPNYAGKIVSGFSATTQIRRSDWGITRTVPFVSDEILISIETEMNRNATDADAGMPELNAGTPREAGGDAPPAGPAGVVPPDGAVDRGARAPD